MSLTGLYKIRKFTRTDYDETLTGTVLYEPVSGINHLDNSAQLSTTSFAVRYSTPITTITQTGGQIQLWENNIYTVTISSNTTFVLPTPTDTSVKNVIKLYLHYTDASRTILWGTSYFTANRPITLDAGHYIVYYEWVGSNWSVGTLPAPSSLIKPLPAGTVLFSNRTPGNYSLELTTSQRYQITIVGGGGGGCTGSGGSSGAFIGQIKLDAPLVLNITVGAGGVAGNRNTSDSGINCRGGTTSVSDLCAIGGGYGGGAQRHSSATAQLAGEACSDYNSGFTVIKNVTGNAGDGWVSGGHGGYSVISGDLNGAGAGGSGTNSSTTTAGAVGQSGWVEIMTV